MRRNLEYHQSRTLGALSKAFLVLVGVVWLLFHGMMMSYASPGSRNGRERVLSPTEQLLKQYLKLVGKERHAPYWDLDLNSFSKRRVPNGPDPIHNRKAVKYRQPPGV